MGNHMSTWTDISVSGGQPARREDQDQVLQLWRSWALLGDFLKRAVLAAGTLLATIDGVDCFGKVHEKHAVTPGFAVLDTAAFDACAGSHTLDEFQRTFNVCQKN